MRRGAKTSVVVQFAGCERLRLDIHADAAPWGAVRSSQPFNHGPVPAIHTQNREIGKGVSP